MTDRWALCTVTRKDGIAELARELVARGYRIAASSGTARFLNEHGIVSTEVGDLTGRGELLGGRVKTLSTEIFAGILARRADAGDLAELSNGLIPRIDFVACNLYEFRNDLAESAASIDIGGHALIRAAAKNWRDVVITVDPSDYDFALSALGTGGLEARRDLAARAWRYVATADAAIAASAEPKVSGETLTNSTRFGFSRARALRYGENPHQKAQWLMHDHDGLARSEVIQGKELSYNNILDLASAAALAHDLGAGGVAVVKHQNPCGAARAEVMSAALRQALDADRASAFGGIVALNGSVDRICASILDELFLEVIVAPKFDGDALEIFRRKKNLRIVAWDLRNTDEDEFRSVPGGMLVQTRDSRVLRPEDWRVVTQRAPTAAESAALGFAEIVCKHARSNAIVLAKGERTIGIGAGQSSRVESVRIAARKCGNELTGSVMASDAFFPFADGLAEAPGITAVIQPGGSVRDQEVIEEADRRGIAMCFSGVRRFRH